MESNWRELEPQERGVQGHVTDPKYRRLGLEMMGF